MFVKLPITYKNSYKSKNISDKQLHLISELILKKVLYKNTHGKVWKLFKFFILWQTGIKFVAGLKFKLFSWHNMNMRSRILQLLWYVSLQIFLSIFRLNFVYILVNCRWNFIIYFVNACNKTWETSESLINYFRSRNN